MQPPIAARRPFEMLHRIGHINPFAVDARLVEQVVQQPAGRTDERASLPVVLISGLLAHEDDPGVGRTFSENGLGGVLEKIAASVALHGGS